jgi:hypothetical protein
LFFKINAIGDIPKNVFNNTTYEIADIRANINGIHICRGIAKGRKAIAVADIFNGIISAKISIITELFTIANLPPECHCAGGK